jgi:hypothetical protein
MIIQAEEADNYVMVKKRIIISITNYHRHLMMYVGRRGLKIVGLSLPQNIGNWNSPIWDTIYLHDFGTHKEILVRYGDVLETISAGT